MKISENTPAPRSLASNLARRAAFEELVGKTSRSFVGLPGDRLDSTIVQALAEIGNFVGADRSYVFIYDRPSETMSNTHEWCAEGIEPQCHILQDLPMEAFSWAVNHLDQHPVREIPRVADLPPEAQAEKDILEEQDILSLVLVSMRNRDGERVGFLGFDAVTKERPWEDEDIYLLEVLGGIIAAAREHHQVMAQLAESEACIRATIEAIPDLIFIFDDEGVIQDFRAPQQTQLALSPERVKGSSIWDIIGSRYHGPVARAIIQASKKGSSGEFEYDLEIGGRLCHYEGRLTLQRDGVYLALIRDVTERKESEQALRRLALQLTAAEEEQRRELALQLHDGIGQELTGLMLRLQNLVSVQGDPEEQKDRISKAVALLQNTLRHTQDLTFDLSPPILYELGLAQALKALVKRFDDQEEPRFVMSVDGDDWKLENSVGILLYRIARELLSNVVKHAEANLVELRLEKKEGEVTLSVTDDGKGFDPGTLETIGRQTRGGFGLFSIKQRLEPLGGRLQLDMQLGTTITITIPRYRDNANAKMEATL